MQDNDEAAVAAAVRDGAFTDPWMDRQFSSQWVRLTDVAPVDLQTRGGPFVASDVCIGGAQSAKYMSVRVFRV